MSNTGSLDLSPGQVLKALREERNLSLDDVYEKTRISVKKLSWLENDAFSEFEAPVFVRGYLRSYARVVGGDSNKLVRLYDQTLESDEAESGEHEDFEPDLRSPAQQSIVRFSQNFINKTSMWSVAGALLICWLLVTFAFRGDENSANQVSISDVSEPEVQSAGPPPQHEKLADESLETADAESSDIATATAEVIVPSAVAGVELSSDSFAEISDSEPQIASETGEVLLEAVEPDSFENQNFLGFEFSDECWVEVRDAFDKVIFADLRNKGDNLRLSGVAPFNIMLGNARATELTIDGEPVELRVSGSRNTLRLTVFAN